MIKPSNKIILVDDTEEDLERLASVFYENGIGCRKMRYDPFYDNPLSGVRIAFFDINLTAGGGGLSDNSRNATLQDAITRYIASDNESYVLVFWTNHTEWIDEFIKYMNRDQNDVRKRNKPFYITSIDKTDFIDKSKKYDEKINQIMDLPAIKCLMQYDNLLSDVSWRVISQLINLISGDSNWGDTRTFEENCKKVFAAIAQQTAGSAHAKENPDLAIQEATMPVIEDLLHKKNEYVWRDFLSDTINGKNVLFPDKFNIEGLNTIFHIDSVGPFNINDRGVVCKINCTEKNPCDTFIKHFEINYCDWFSMTTLCKEDRQQAIPIGMELSAACDFSNNKKRTHRYILGILIPAECRQRINTRAFGDYNLMLPFNFEFGEEKKTICFNLNYIFTVSKNETSLVLQEPLFRLKKEIVDFIGEKFAQHSSRIGIISFR